MSRRLIKTVGAVVMLLTVSLVSGVAAKPSDTGPLDPGEGVLLVARSGLPDPRFHESVVLLLQHDQQGSVGVIVNRPSRLPLSELLPEQAELFGTSSTLSYGGPVASRSIVALISSTQDPPEPSRRIFGQVYLTGEEGLIAWLEPRDAKSGYRVFLGYAGWAPGQLEGELAHGDWGVFPVSQIDLFGSPDADLWQQLSRP